MCIRDSFYTEWGAHVGVLAANLIMLAIPLGGLLLLTKFKVRDRLVGRNENPLTPETATYRESAFYRYHAKVLNDLGMVEIGDFHQTGGPSILTRTIFLSPNGNLLVELGVEQGLPFFVIESLINSDKFLETHSMVSRWGEIRSESKPHQRRSANHKDIMRALQSHDELVNEHTFSGSNREAKFTAENFGRFLSFPTSA